MSEEEINALKIQAIVKAVEELQGCKGVDLAVRCAESFTDGEDFTNTLEKAVEQGELIEFGYKLPNMNYRLKAFYLPKGCVNLYCNARVTTVHLPRGESA